MINLMNLFKGRRFVACKTRASDLFLSSACRSKDRSSLVLNPKGYELCKPIIIIRQCKTRLVELSRCCKYNIKVKTASYPRVDLFLPVNKSSSWFGSYRPLASHSQLYPQTKPGGLVAIRKMSNTTTVKQFNQKFLDAAAYGSLEDLKTFLGSVDIDVRSDRGWTALMFAARNGHISIVSALIEKGCDIQAMNASGQTALDIAQFWNHKEAASILSQHKENVLFDQIHNYYSLNPLYRASDIRKDETTLQVLKRNVNTKFVLFEQQKPFLLPPEGKGKRYKFALFSCDQLPSPLLEESTVIFLGLETWDPSSSAWFAVDAKENALDLTTQIYPKGSFVTPFPATMQMEETHAGIFAEAHSILCWLERYRFCPTCGARQRVIDEGYKQVCENAECSSHKGIHNTCYPRVDPSLIMLVVSPDKKMCLLGRQKRFPPKMYSCLAGFMEPGECIEDTCRREVEEESGVKIGKVDYHSSQPWPFPATLMLGCIAYARTDTLKIDKEELEEARWFPRAEVAQMVAGQHPDGIFVPPKQAIAHQLIKSWLASGSSHL